MSLIYVSMSMSVMMGFVSLAVDLGRVQVAKTELRRTADAAARAAAAGISSGVSTAQANASSIVALNTVDGSTASIVVDSDVEFGTWSSENRTFTVLTGANRSNANAIRVTMRRTAARGNAVPLVFAQVLGRSSCDVSATSTAMISTGNSLQFVGLDSIDVKNNLAASVYDSSVTTSPSSSNNNGGATLASNGAVTAKNNEDLAAILLGPAGSSNLDVTPTTLSSAITSPTMPTQPTGTSDLSVSGTVTYPGGTYNWDDVSFANNAELKFTGPATVHITGNVIFAKDATITASSNRPTNLTIYQYGSSFGSSNANDVDITANIIAPNAAFVSKNNAVIKGRMFFKSVYSKNNFTFYYDQSLTPMYGSGTGGISTVR